jgi:putative membrane protein
MKQLLIGLGTIALYFALAGGAFAQQPPSAPTQPQIGRQPAGPGVPSAAKSISSADRKFMEEAAAGGMAEVDLGKLAQEKGSSDKVKQFGKRMEDDHGKGNQELMALAQSKGVPLPATITSMHRRLHNRLSKLSGTAFDREYVKEMVKDHEKDVAAFRRMSQGAADPDLKAWATKTLPTLEDHLRQVRGIQGEVKG